MDDRTLPLAAAAFCQLSRMKGFLFACRRAVKWMITVSTSAKGVALMPRILVSDEHGVYRTGLRMLVKTRIPDAEVMEASSPIEGFSRIRYDDHGSRYFGAITQ